jgi:adenylate cyclase
MTVAKTRRMPFVLALGVWAAAFAVLHTFGLWHYVEYSLLDNNLRRLAAHSPPDADVILIDIDEPALDAMANEYGRFPWTRAVYGTLIEGIARQKPAAIVFDILFTDPHREHADDDLYFVRAAQKTPNVFFPMVRLPGGVEADTDGYPLNELKSAQPTADAAPNARAALLLPLPGIAATGRLGTIDLSADADGVIRRYPLYREIAGWRIPSLPARVADALGYAMPNDDTLMLVWHGPERSYKTVSFHDVLFDLERRQPKRPRDEFTDKIVVIGGSAAGLFDIKLTPMSAIYPGPEIVATALDNLKNHETYRLAPWWMSLLLSALLLLGLAGAFAWNMGPLRAGIGMIATTAVFVGGGMLALLQSRYAMPVVGPLAAGWIGYVLMAVRAYLVERHNRQRVTELFGRFLDPRVVADLVTQGADAAASGGEKREVTVLFSDIRGFTTLSERQSPQEVVELLNRYFRVQVEVIFKHGGTLDKYIGDAIMAFWGAPGTQPDHARRALAAARDMEQALLRFRDELGPAAKDFDVGIGLNTGEVIVGFIGSPEHRQDYTVIGDAVNTASRIEGATRDRARVLVSEATRNAVGFDVQFRDHGFVALKGKEEKIHLYEPL